MNGRPRDPSVGKLDVRAQVARTLLTREIGQRIPTLQELQVSTRVGTGTVIKALHSLQDIGAVQLNSRGHKGTVITDRNVGELWHAGVLGNLRLLMPPPGPTEQLGIVAALQAALNRVGVALVLTYQPGAGARLGEIFHETVDATVTSTGAFKQSQDSHPSLRATDLGAYSFYARSSLVIVARPDPGPRRLRVGIDRGSHDHQTLTETEFADQDVEFVPCRFVYAPAAVLAGQVDLAIWHAMPTVIPPVLAGLELRPVSDATIEKLTDVSTGVLVTRNLDAPVNALLRSVSTKDVASAQAQLLKLAEQEALRNSIIWPQ